MADLQPQIGLSVNPDIQEAVTTAARLARLDEQPNLTFLFSTPHYPGDRILDILQKKFRARNLIGASTAGVIVNDRIYSQAVCLVSLKSETLRFKMQHVDNTHLQSLDEVARQIDAGPVARLRHPNLLFFMDGLTNEASSFCAGLRPRSAKQGFTLGVQACDDFRFQNTYQYCDNIVSTRGLALLALGTDHQAVAASSHGYRPLGKPRTVTRAEKHIIHSIDDKPARRLYEEFFQEEAETLSTGMLSHIRLSYPLGIRLSERHYLIRHVLRAEKDGSLVCADQIPRGAQVHIMMGSKDSARQAALETAHDVREQLSGTKPSVVFMFESLARQRLLGRSNRKQLADIRRTIGDDVPIVGMLTYGQTVPYQRNPEEVFTDLQNHNIMLLALA